MVEKPDRAIVFGVEQFDRDVTATRAMDPCEGAGRMMGRYHLLERIGEGGMGEVWLAEQKAPVHRRVALKLIKTGMDTREVIARFESERQALALMNHPAIARVFDAGSTSQGAPYFVMEYVAGIPITTYCDNHLLSTRDRLNLFIRVCEAVQHAHQKAIIHRDLKPSNILVTEIDGQLAPKIIDFGVAKAINQRLTPHTMFTRLGALIGTPEYMSPEQAACSGEDVDTRTDVYSLGIILYELLAGGPPIELGKIAFDEFLRRLREDDTPKPSTKIRMQDATTSSAVARKRRTEPLALVKQMRGDLDLIVLKALEKERTRRYGSPAEFAADVGRFLNNQPVTAVPPSVIYCGRKFARRYRVALTTVAAFVIILVAAAAVGIRQTLRADSAAAVAQAVNDFLQNDVLSQAGAINQSGPDVKPDADLKVKTALDRAATRIAGKFDKQPLVEAAIRETIGRTYIDLGQYRQAGEQLKRALDLDQRLVGADNPMTLGTTDLLGLTAEKQRNYAEAGALYRQTLQISRRALGSENPITLSCMHHLAWLYCDEGKYAQAEALFRETLEIRHRVLGTEHRDTLSSMNNLALVYSRQGDYARAETLNNQILQIRRRVLGAEDPNTLDSMNNLAADYRQLGKYQQAEALDSQVLEIRLRERGPEHPSTLRSMNNLAEDAFAQHNYAPAEALDRRVLEVRQRVLGPEHPDTLRSMHNLATVYLYQAKYTEAELLFRTSLARNPNAAAKLNALAWYLVSVPDSRQRRPAEALQLSRKAVKEAPNVATDYNTLGLSEYRNNLWDEAITTLNKSLEMNKGKDPTDFFFLAMAHAKRGENGEAEHFFQEGIERAGKDASIGREVRMFWGEAAAALDKPGPVPTLLEAQNRPDLVPLRARPDCQALMRSLRMGTVH
jgi:tetratricopeptide (TPR) repeat protein